MSNADCVIGDRLPTLIGAVAQLIARLIYRCGGSDGFAWERTVFPFNSRQNKAAIHLSRLQCTLRQRFQRRNHFGDENGVRLNFAQE